MSRKKVQAKPDFNASAGEKDRYFARIYPGMLQSKAFQSLTPGARVFYICCRTQASSSEGRSCLFKHGKEFGVMYNPETTFVFPTSHLERYGYKRPNAIKYFRELTDAGFIQVIENNSVRFRVNVYAFASKWREEPEETDPAKT